MEAPWLGSRMPDSRSREPGQESPTYNCAVDGDMLWRCYATTKTKKFFITCVDIPDDVKIDVSVVDLIAGEMEV